MAKISFTTFGCTLNVSDSELMAGLLEEAGYEITEEKDSDLVVVNSCTVKALAETKFFKKIEQLKTEGKKMVVTGCIPQAQPDLFKTKLADYSIIGTSQLNKIVEAVEETLAGNVLQNIKKEKNPRLNLPKIRKNKIVEIVPICEGCLGTCTYCQTKHARGRLLSYEPEAIVKQITDAVKEGVKEVWLTSQDCGAYGKDINTNIVELLRKVTTINGDFQIRVGMMNPNFVKDFIDDLIDLFLKEKKIFKFIHIPVQAGNNKVLKDMAREYTVEEYKKIVTKIREKIPQMTIATDIICGFPSETDEEFEDTLRLIRETKPDLINKSRFWPRKNTKAVLMKQHKNNVTKDRSKLLKIAFDDMAEEKSKYWQDWRGLIIIDDKGKNDKDGNSSWLGRNYAYKQVVVKGEFKLGETVEVKIIKTNKHYLVGEVIK